MFQDRCYDRDTIDINNNYYAENMVNDVDMDYNNANMGMNMNYQNEGCNSPIVEPMQEKCVHRTIMHDVPHACHFMYDIF